MTRVFVPLAALLLTNCARGPAMLPLPHPELKAVEPEVRWHIEAVKAAGAFGPMGEAYHAHEFRDAAAVCYENASRVEPANWRWPGLLAELLWEQGKAPEAEAAMRRAEALLGAQSHPDPIELGAQRAFLGDAARSQGHAGAAASWYARAAELNHADVHSRLQLALQMAHSGQAADAFVQAGELLAKLPGHPEAIRAMAKAQEAAGNAEAAHRTLERLEGLPPAAPLARPPLYLPEIRRQRVSSSGLIERASDALASGRVREASELALDVLARNPTDRDLVHQLATVLSVLGKTDEAIRLCEQNLRAHPDFAAPRLILAVALLKSGGDLARIDKELALLRKADPGNPAGLAALGDLELARRRPAQARAAFAALRRANPALVRGWTGEAQALLDAGDARRARALLEEFHRTQPAHNGATQVLARFLAACPRAEGRDGQRAVMLAQGLFENGKTAERAEALAMAKAEVGSFDEAVELERWAVAQLGQQADASLRARHAMLLELYGRRQPCRDLAWRPEAYAR